MAPSAGATALPPGSGSRNRLYEYLAGKNGRDLDADMLELIERERTATVTRRLALRQLRNKIASAIGKEINSDAA